MTRAQQVLTIIGVSIFTVYFSCEAMMEQAYDNSEDSIELTDDDSAEQPEGPLVRPKLWIIAAPKDKFTPPICMVTLEEAVSRSCAGEIALLVMRDESMTPIGVDFTQIPNTLYWPEEEDKLPFDTLRQFINITAAAHARGRCVMVYDQPGSGGCAHLFLAAWIMIKFKKDPHETLVMCPDCDPARADLPQLEALLRDFSAHYYFRQSNS